MTNTAGIDEKAIQAAVNARAVEIAVKQFEAEGTIDLTRAMTRALQEATAALDAYTTVIQMLRVTLSSAKEAAHE